MKFIPTDPSSPSDSTTNPAIASERRGELEALAGLVVESLGEDGSVGMNFICTHNSRRSHMAQLWAAAAFSRAGVAGTETFSGGTEATAFHPNAVAAMRRAGWQIVAFNPVENPVYQSTWGAGHEPIESFSKTFDHRSNPSDGFIAIMVCDDAAEACPLVAGAEHRVALTYVDPKVSDGTSEQEATYDERCAQIAREMVYLAGQVAEKMR